MKGPTIPDKLACQQDERATIKAPEDGMVQTLQISIARSAVLVKGIATVADTFDTSYMTPPQFRAAALSLL